jgi:hypothetical protein
MNLLSAEKSLAAASFHCITAAGVSSVQQSTVEYVIPDGVGATIDFSSRTMQHQHGEFLP